MLKYKNHNFTLTLILLISFFYVNAQTGLKTDNNSFTEANYERNSLSIVLVDFPTLNMKNRVIKTFDNINKVPDKYDENVIEKDNTVINVAITPKIETANNSIFEVMNAQPLANEDKNGNVIMEEIKDKNIHFQVLDNWFNVKKDNSDTYKFDFEKVFERALYSVQDQNVEIAQRQKLGLNLIKDRGIQLIGNSFILAYVYDKVRNYDEYYDEIDERNKERSKKTLMPYTPVLREKEGYICDASVFIFKLNMNPETVNNLLTSLNFETNQLDTDKYNNIFSKNEPFVYMAKISFSSEMSQYIAGHASRSADPYTDEELFTYMLYNSVSSSLTEIARSYPVFRVKSPTVFPSNGKGGFKSKPIGAKIGKKEGLKIDDRYFAWTQKYDKATQSTKWVRRGVVRAKVVKDNRKNEVGKTDTSYFYQVAGRNFNPYIRPILEERPDYGLGFSIGYAIGEIGGFGARIEYNISPIIGNNGFTSFKVYADGFFQIKSYKNDLIKDENGQYSEQDYTFVMGNLGFGKDIYFFNNFHITPCLGYGVNQAILNKSIGIVKYDYSIRTFMLHAGARFAFNLAHNVQIVASAYYYVPTLTQTVLKIGDEEITQFSDKKWEDFFENRKGLSTSFMLRFQF